MSEGQLPAYVDTRRAFLQEMEVSGAVAIDRLARFRELLVSDEATIDAELHFSLNNEGQRQITGMIAMTAEVRCERCLEPVTVQLQESPRLILLDSEAAADGLNKDWDPWIVAGFKLQLAEIVEEQLILALPAVNYHGDKACIKNLDYQQQDIEQDNDASLGRREESPFAVLKRLKSNDESD